MDIIAGFIICFVFLAYAIGKDMFLGIPLVCCIAVFAILASKRGNSLKDIWNMFFSGARKSFGILKIFVLLGAIGSVWIYSGTLPSMIFYCLEYVTPGVFILFCFVACCIVSYLNGSSFGTVGTMGVALITMGRAAGIPADLVAGAIISGAYFGDRGSPVSSAGALVAVLTDTRHMDNVKNMHISVVAPGLASLVFFGVFSLFYPLKESASAMSGALSGSFAISWIALIPAAIMFFLPLLRVSVYVSMMGSIVTAFAISVFLQDASWIEVLKSLIVGVSLEDSSLAEALSSGGIKDMLVTYVVVFLSCALAGLFSGVHAFDVVKDKIKQKASSGRSRIIATCLVSLFTCAYGCNQTIASILTCEIMEDSYEEEKSRLALDVGNSALVIAGLIPWSVASFVPTGLLGVGKAGYLPFAFFLYAIPVFSVILYNRTGRKV